jgi:hypothetical protein
VRIAVVGHGRSSRQPRGMRRNRNRRLPANSHVSNTGFERLRTPTNVGEELRLEDESYPEAASVMHKVAMHKALWRSNSSRGRMTTHQLAVQAGRRTRADARTEMGEERACPSRRTVIHLIPACTCVFPRLQEQRR